MGKQRKRFFVYFSPLFHLFLCTVALKKVGRKREMEKEPGDQSFGHLRKKKRKKWDGMWERMGCEFHLSMSRA